MSSTQRSIEPDTTRVDDELLTMQEAADVVRVPVATLRYWRHLGTGPRSFRIGRSVRYTDFQRLWRMIASSGVPWA